MRANFLIFSLIFSLTMAFAYSPIFVPEWSWQTTSPPVDLVLYDIDDDRLAEIAIAQAPNRIIILNNTGDSILWTFQTSSAITRLAVLQQAKEEPFLIAGASPYLWAVNCSGKVAWQVILTGIANQPILWLATGNFDTDLGDEILAVTRNSFYIVLPNRKLVRKVILPFLPKQVEIGNLNYDVYQEIVISDFNRLIVYASDGDILSDLTLTNLNDEINRGFDLYDFNSDRIEEIIAMMHTKLESAEGETNLLSCFSASGAILWQNRKIPGSPRTIRILRGEIYVGGTDFNGKDYLIKLDRNGKILKTIKLHHSNTTPILYSPIAKFNLNPFYLQDWYPIGNLLLVALGWRDGKETKITNLRLFSTALDEINLVSPEYLSNLGVVFSDRNQPIIDLCIGSVNGDTLVDILVARARGQKNYVIDCLINRSELIARAEQERWNNFRNALFLRKRSLAGRCRRQAQILALGFGNIISAARTEISIRQEWRDYLKTIFVRTILWTSIIFLTIGAFSFFIIRPIVIRKTHRLAQVEAKPIATLIRLASELVALNHNYIVKGNWQGAYNRLIEITDSYNLKADRDLSLILYKKTKSESFSEPPSKPVNFQIHYRHFIKRLTDESRTINLVGLIKKICYNVLGNKAQIRELSMNRNEYEPKQINEMKATNLASFVVSFVYLINRDFPDIYQQARLYWDNRLYNWLEHLCTDHLRYAKSYAHFVFDYESATEWNRKLALHFVSDASEKIDFSRKDSHLLTEWEDLKSEYRDYIQLPDNDRALYYPEEKIWIKILDLISILKSIILP